jgi:hypothetical protein
MLLKKPTKIKNANPNMNKRNNLRQAKENFEFSNSFDLIPNIKQKQEAKKSKTQQS